MPSEIVYDPYKNFAEEGDNPNSKMKNIFLVKQNSTGNRGWIIDLGVSDEGSGISMTFDSFENVYLTEYTRNVLEGKKNSGDFTVFLVKYNSMGNREWIAKLGRSTVENGARLITDSYDNIYVTGFSSEFESDNDFGTVNTLLAKYDSSGIRQWTKPLKSTYSDFAWDVTVDYDDNIYVTRFSGNSFAINTGLEKDILLIKFNTYGIKL